MRLLLLVAATTAIVTAADGPSANKAAPAAQHAAAPKSLGIPAGAVESAPGTYHYTDPEGKAWIYRQSPFGVVRLQEKAAAESPTADSFPGLHATEDGDTVRFEQITPFGTRKWQRNKSELDATEQAVWNRDQSRNRKQE